MIGRLAYVSARAVGDSDPDEPLLMTSFAAMGVTASVVAWDDPTVDWAQFDRVVLRATWDYPERIDEFLAWLDRASSLTEVSNDLAQVRWSLDKHYLAALAANGVAITPTTFFEPGATAVLPEHTQGFVVKPAVGAGSRDAARYDWTPADRAAAHAHLTRLLDNGRSVLVQPFLRSISDHGEWPHVFLDGEFSHAASKRVNLPRAGLVEGLFAAEDNRPATPPADVVAEAERAMAVVVAELGVPRYARVDMVLDDEALPCVLEVELIEPSLFLPENPDAVERTARVLAH
jgi:hypothetical protein